MAFKYRFPLLLTLVVLTVLGSTGLPQAARAAGTWFVSVGGSDGNSCSAAGTPCASIDGVLAKPGFVSGDTVRVQSGTFTGGGEEIALLDKSVTLSGGWDAPFTTQNSYTTLDGQNSRSGIRVNAGVTALVDRFVIRNGHAGAFSGGGITNNGTLTLNHSTVRDSTSTIFGAGIMNYVASLTLNDSLVLNNVTTSIGGGIYSWESTSSVTLNRTLIDGNQAGSVDGSGGGGGGGIMVEGGGSLVLNNSTVSRNRLIGSYPAVFLATMEFRRVTVTPEPPT